MNFFQVVDALSSGGACWAARNSWEARRYIGVDPSGRYIEYLGENVADDVPDVVPYIVSVEDVRAEDWYLLHEKEDPVYEV